MEIYTYNAYNPEARMDVNLMELLETNFKSLSSIIKYIRRMKPDIEYDFVSLLATKFKTEVDDFHMNASRLDMNGITDCIDDYPELNENIVQITLKLLNLPSGCVPNGASMNVLILDYLRALMIPKFHRVKALAEILGRQEGIKLWKEVVYQITEDTLRDNKSELRRSTQESIKFWKEHGNSGNCTSNFSLIVFDDHKYLLKVTKCGVHEVTKHLNDPEIAYLSYCWTGRPEDEFNTLSYRRRTTQTLHLADFCDEFFWDQNVHDNPEQPSLELIRSIGQEKK